MSHKEQFCSVGILSLAEQGKLNDQVGECGDVLANIIRQQYPGRVADFETVPASIVIVRFNDHPDTTFADVERVFEKAEVAWDERV